VRRTPANVPADAASVRDERCISLKNDAWERRWEMIMAAVLAFPPQRMKRPLPDAEVVRLACAVLVDRRAWSALGDDLDPAVLRAAQRRAAELLAEALETV
jgi:hypothetical protein